MALPPFDLDETAPAPSDVISQFPANEQTNRDIIESWLTSISDSTTGLLDPNGFPEPFRITDDDDGAAQGPTFELFRDSASPADADNIGALDFLGNDSGGNETVYARITGLIQDATDATEDGDLRLQVISGGSLVQRVTIDGTGTTITGAFTVSTLTATNLNFSGDATGGLFKAANGSASNTALGFSADAGTGFHRPLGSAIDLAISGSNIMRFHSSLGLSVDVGTIVSNNGNSSAFLTASNHGVSQLSGSTVAFHSSGGGSMRLRPNGPGSATGEINVTTTAVTLNNDTTINGELTVTG